MSELIRTTIVVNPATTIAEVLLEGSTLPSWAEGLVGDHLLTSSPAPEGEGPNVDDDPLDDDPLDDDPLDAMKVDELKAYAAANGIDLGKATTKADIRDAIKAADVETDDAKIDGAQPPLDPDDAGDAGAN